MTTPQFAVRIHTLPVNDIRDGRPWVHYASPLCPCQPMPAEPGFWDHHAWDTREAKERNGHATDPLKNWANVCEVVNCTTAVTE